MLGRLSAVVRFVPSSAHRIPQWPQDGFTAPSTVPGARCCSRARGLAYKIILYSSCLAAEPPLGLKGLVPARWEED